ncbi:MAG: sporulation protein [Halobaculum sp.]
MTDPFETVLARFDVSGGTATIGTTERIVVGESVTFLVVLQTRDRTSAVRDVTCEVRVRYRTPTGFDRVVVWEVTIASAVSITDGIRTTSETTVSVPEAMPSGFAGTVLPTTVSMRTASACHDRAAYLKPSFDPAMPTVVDPMVAAGYVVDGCEVIADRTNRGRTYAQVVRFVPTAEAPTTAPVSVFVRSVPDGIAVAPVTDHDAPELKIDTREWVIESSTKSNRVLTAVEKAAGDAAAESGSDR